jgi:membrane-associated phospholipid phosphatase
VIRTGTRTHPYVLLGVLCCAAFVGLGLVVRHAPGPLDRLLRDTVGTLWQGEFGTVAWLLSAVLGPVLPLLLGAGLLVATVLWRLRGDPRAGVTLRVLVLLLLCRLTSWVAKPLFARQRPREYADFSYPSGHVVSVACTGVAVVVLCVWLAPTVTSLARTAAVTATLLACAARLTYGVHWLTDALGAVLAVSGVALLACPALRLLPAPRPGPTTAKDGTTGAER